MTNEDRVGSSAAWWALVLLTATYTFSFIDRQIINLLVDPIRADLSLSDSQVSFLQGLAFVLPYVILSIPLGRIVDRANRIRVLVIGILVWTISCVTCGLAKNFWQLGVARMGVGAGEASVTPASWSLLADYFPENKRALPVSIFLMGPYLGAGLSLILGAEVVGWASGLGAIELPIVGALAPWQLTFMLVAIPGLLMVFLLPLLQRASPDTAADSRQLSRSAGTMSHTMSGHAEVYLALSSGCAVYCPGALRFAGLGAELADSRARTRDRRSGPLLRNHRPDRRFSRGAERPGGGPVAGKTAWTLPVLLSSHRFGPRVCLFPCLLVLVWLSR